MEEAAQRLFAGDQRTLSKLISLIERGDAQAAGVLKAVDPHTDGAYVIGITGPPGAGKSTIVDRLTELLRAQDLTVGIIGVDPTSAISGGALLGDRVRMQRHYLDGGVFIRSIATRGHSGGLPRIVPGVVRLLDAAGINVLLVETIGVGQTDLGILEVADTVLVILVPEAGDSIQALKAGMMEIGDIYVVNKSDREGASHMASTVTSMLHMGPPRPDWSPPVTLTAAQSGDGIQDLWDHIQEHRRVLTDTSQLTVRRSSRRQKEFMETVEDELTRRVKASLEADSTLATTLEMVARKEAEPYSSAMEYLDSRLPELDSLSS